MTPEEILSSAEASLNKSLDHLHHEMRGIRTGRATPALIEYVKVEAYGSENELRGLGMVTAPEATQLLVKPFDPSTVQAIVKGIEAAGLGLRAVADGKVVRVSIPALSGDRRKELISSVKKMGEDSRVAMRNARRDANKNLDTAGKDKTLGLSEDEVSSKKDAIQDLLKKFEAKVDGIVKDKIEEIETV